MTGVGVYALVNWRAGLMYLGSSGSLDARERVWRSRLSCIEVEVWPEQVSKRFYEAARGLSAADWQFVVVERFGATVDRAAVKAAEYRYVDCLRRLWKPAVLNVVLDAERDAERERERLGGVRYVHGFRPRPYDGRGRRW